MIIILDDINYPNIVWSNVPAYSEPFSSECDAFLELCSNFDLIQLTPKPTRLTPTAANVLDLALSTSPELVSPISLLQAIRDRLVFRTLKVYKRL